MTESFMAELNIGGEINFTKHSSLVSSDRYGNLLIGKVVGYTIPKNTKVSRLCVVFVTNNEKVYRVELWKDKITDDRLDVLKLGNVVKMTQLEKREFYMGISETKHPPELSTDFQFSVCADSIFEVLKEGNILDNQEYPAKNPFPPFWKMIPEMKDDNICKFLICNIDKKIINTIIKLK